MLVAFSSPVKFSKFCAKFEVVQQQFLSVVRCESLTRKQTFFYRKLSSRKRGNSLTVFYRNSLNGSSLTKINQHDKFTRAFSRRYRKRAKNQSDCRIRYRPSCEKVKSICKRSLE